MKSTKILKLLCLALLLVLTVAALAACAGTPPEPPACTHDWVAGEFTVRPICGEVSEGKRTYTCSLCNETKEETVTNTATEHSFDDGVVTLAPTCDAKGTKTYTCTTCGDTKQNDIASLGGHVYDIYSSEIVIDEDANKRYIPCVNEGCESKLEKEAYVTYEQFGAKGDGVTDDYQAMKATHTYANEWGIEVRGTKKAEYYICVAPSSILIQTDVDWNGAFIIIDDSKIPWNDYNARTVHIFKVTSKTAAKSITVPTGMRLTKGQTNIGMTFSEPCMLRLENNTTCIFVRHGENADDGDPMNEVILVDENGNVDPSTPIQYDYNTVTSIKAYSITDAPITISNGRFKTITCDPKIHDPNYVNEYYYFYRGLEVSRSNTTLDGLGYFIEGEHKSEANEYNNRGVPYNGSFSFLNAYNVTFRDSRLETHKTYSFFETNGTRNEMGTYTLNATNCINISFIGLKQQNALTDRIYSHGIMGSNYCRNFYVEDCQLDRFDAHKGLHNATIKNTTLGFGCLIIGGGTLNLENVERLSGSEFITLRYDYNSLFDGTVNIKNCEAASSIAYIIGGNWKSHDTGLTQISVREMNIDGLKLNGGAVVQLFYLAGVSSASLTDVTSPLVLPEQVTVHGISGNWVISNSPIYKNVPLIRK